MLPLDFDIQTPIQELHTIFIDAHDASVSIKRDDLIHPFVSGNKWRKLKYNVAQASELGINHLITCGGAYSNHIIATAFAGAIHGFQTTGIIRGDELSPNSNYVLKLAHQMGMELKFVTRQEYPLSAQLAESMTPGGYFIPQGGENALGVKGCTEIMDDTTAFYQHIFVASGTGTTAQGIGSRLQEYQHLHAIDCVGFDDTIETHLKETIPDGQWTFHKEYTFGGFGKYSEELMAFCKSFGRETGILLDPIYTGKMMFAVYDLIGTGRIPKGESILCIHTGGMTGVLSPKWLKTG